MGRLVAEWHDDSGSTVASLIGTIDADALPVLVGLRAVAEQSPHLVIDLAHVESIDDTGVELLEALSGQENVEVINISDAVTTALADNGRSSL